MPNVADGPSCRSLRVWLGVSIVLVLAGCSGDEEGQSATTTSSAGAEIVVEHQDWGAVFDEAGVIGTFALREVGSDETHVWNSERAAQRRRPASTFKILNAMIILETAVRDDVDEVVPWDGVVREVPEWNRDHSLRSGISVSAVWMFQSLAREVGEVSMAEWVGAVGYGNADIGGGIDQFWLSGDLEISPLEQLDFLEAMVDGGLGFRSDVVDAVRDILVREQGDGWTWSHKTGTALIEEPSLGWLVGTTSHLDRDWVFAMNIDLGAVDDAADLGGPDGQIDPQLRQNLSRKILQAEGALPDAE